MHLIRKISPKITTDKTLMQTKRKNTNPRTRKPKNLHYLQYSSYNDTSKKESKTERGIKMLLMPVSTVKPKNKQTKTEKKNHLTSISR